MTAFEYAPQERLLKALAEELKLPLLHIARSAELASIDPTVSFKSVGYTADMAIRLIDSYLLGLRVQGQPILELEPVSVASLLQDVAHRLTPLARQRNLELEVSINGKYGPVMANRPQLEAAYMALGHSLIEAQSSQSPRVLLAAHKSKDGIVAGVFSNAEGLSSDMFRRARALYGTARQSAPGMSAQNGAGIFIANALLESMQAPLKVAHHHHMSGLAATLLPSKQLQLV